MSSFDRKFARVLLEICRYTYANAFDDAQNAADAQDALRKMVAYGAPEGVTPAMFRSGPTSVACVTAYEDRNVVSYMGTKTEFKSALDTVQSVQDWLENFRAEMVPFRLSVAQLGGAPAAGTNPDDLGGRVHAGFLEELATVQEQVVQALLARGGRGRPVYVTGHSQGGAEAALATRALLAGGFPVVAAYTFAAPRPGNQDFVNTVPTTLPVHRIEFGDDIVPHVPPRLLDRAAQELLAGFDLLPFLPDRAKTFLRFARDSAARGYVGLGRLCYGSTKTQSLRVDLSAADEQALFNDRLWSLARHPERWADHHHLAGTTADVAAGVEGNYSALVSRYALVE